MIAATIVHVTATSSSGTRLPNTPTDTPRPLIPRRAEDRSPFAAPRHKRSVVSRPESDCWLHPEIEVRPSPIQGRGLFARAPVRAGTAVARLGGRLVSGDTLLQLLMAAARAGSNYVDTIVVAEDLHLLIAPRQPIHYGNHSCDPNLWWAGPYTLIARRPIEPGDEVTSDYGTSTGADDFVMTCTCGTALCRGGSPERTGDDQT